jgi:hypothetical protein
MTTPTHTCYTVRDRGEGKKPFWAPIGSAWTNKDGSFTIRLDSLPIDGEIVVRTRKQDEKEPA